MIVFCHSAPNLLMWMFVTTKPGTMRRG